MVKKPSFALPTHNSSIFTSTGDKRWCAEASDFGGLGVSWKSQVWRDAADRGFYVLEFTEGRKTLFTQVNVIESREGELVGWVFASAPGRGACDGVTITVFND